MSHPIELEKSELALLQTLVCQSEAPETRFRVGDLCVHWRDRLQVHDSWSLLLDPGHAVAGHDTLERSLERVRLKFWKPKVLRVEPSQHDSLLGYLDVV